MKKFDRDKYLKQLKFKRAWHKYERYFYIGIPCLMIAILGIYFAYSKFSSSKEEEVVKTTVGKFIHGDVVIGAYIDGEYSKTIPGKNDSYVVEKVVCDNEAQGEWDNDKWGLLTTNMTKRSKCNVYFKSNPLNKVISQLDTTGKCPTVNEDGTVNVSGAESENSLLCSAPDAYGTSYYYRGNVTNNYVKFAGFYWRIVRINGDGSVRVIYDGTSVHTNDDTSDDRLIGTSAFNLKNSTVSSYLITGAAYIGYMYGNANSALEAEMNINTNDSTIKSYIDDWYEKNIKSTSNEMYILDNMFCNDRSLTVNDSGYGGYFYRPRDFKRLNQVLLSCQQQNDAFTVSDTSKGNGALTYGIGLITSDEIVLSGGWESGSSSNSYLNTIEYWTMSPSFWSAFPYPFLSTLYVITPGTATPNGYESYGVRPVISLSSEVLTYGDGTANNPYRLSFD